MSCCAVLCYAVLCCAVLSYAMVCCAMLRYVVLCYAMLCYAIIFFSLLCCAMLCCAMLCHAMLCSPNTGITGTCGSCWLLICLLGFTPRLSCLLSKCSYLLGYVPSPKHAFLKNHVFIKSSFLSSVCSFSLKDQNVFLFCLHKRFNICFFSFRCNFDL